MILLRATGLHVVVHDVSRETADPMDPVRAFAPHLFVLGAAVSGFRITADIIAIFAAIGWGLLSGFLVLISLGTSGSAMLFALIQLALLIFAARDVFLKKNWVWRPASWTRRLSGPVLAGAIALLISASLHRSSAVYTQRRAEEFAKRARDSVARVEEHARVLASDAWKPTSALNQLHILTHCIDVYHRAGPARARPFPRSFAELVRWATSDEMRGYGDSCYQLMRDADTTRTPPLLDPHHRVRYTPPPRLSDTLHARAYTLELESVWDTKDEPVTRGAPGAKNYLLDRTGKVHWTMERRRATASDRVMRLCPPTVRTIELCWIDSEHF